MRLIFVLTLLLLSFSAHAAGGLSVDASFDLTGDGIVDAADWAKMSEDARRRYADQTISALGEDPDAMLDDHVTRGQRYLQGLRSVYE
ncbi:hypothetical protein FE236_03650 [Mariprofundus erugo]|uniref:EF-hand domain-containing protein n=1 Tax=Mariprofundus erugo TaxID=2528639 RepID=A0A5R9GRL5_9PROT|nr:hypothetical protein [Mariprofundus erugo]TLS67053.1 hypothetical protein FEF65_08890 [Mariprofundus erugo]TLS77249.1 hypothetical protein FE236_03650 [Mariprofundus erugo]